MKSFKDPLENTDDVIKITTTTKLACMNERERNKNQVCLTRKSLYVDGHRSITT